MRINPARPPYHRQNISWFGRSAIFWIVSKYRDNGDILPRVLTLFTLSMMCIVEVGDGRSQRLDPRCGTIFSSIDGDVNLLGPLKASLDVIVDLWSSLT